MSELIGNQKVARTVIRHLPELAVPQCSADWLHARGQLQRDGFVLLRGAFPAEMVAACRSTMLAQLRCRGGIDEAAVNDDPQLRSTAPIARDENGKWQAGWTTDAITGRVVDFRDPDEAGWARVGASKAVQAIYNGPTLQSYAEQLLLDADSRDRVQSLPHYTWLRMKGRGDVTIEHADYYFFNRSTQMFALNGLAGMNADPAKPLHPNACSSCERDSQHSSPYIKSGASAKAAQAGNEWVECELCQQIAYHRACLEHSLSESSGDDSKQSQSAMSAMSGAMMGSMSGSMAGSMSAMHCKSSTTSTPWHCASCLSGHLPVYTCWVALGPVKATDGTLCFVPGSHLWSGFDRPTPRTAQVPREFTERLRRQKKGKKSLKDAADGVVWYSADYQPGDLVIFNVKTVHAASKNMSSNYRLSLDTRLVVVPGTQASGQPAAQRDSKRRKTETK